MPSPILTKQNHEQDIEVRSPRLQLFRRGKTPRQSKSVLGAVISSFRRSPKSSPKSTPDPEQVKIQSPPTKKHVSSAPPSPIVTTSCSMEMSIPLLASEQLDDNQRGIQILMKLIKLSKIITSSHNNISRRLIVGVKDHAASRIRRQLLSFICDGISAEDYGGISDDEEWDGDSVISALSDTTTGISDDSTWEEEFDDFDLTSEHPPGRHLGCLHFASLRVLVECLDHLHATSASQARHEKNQIKFTMEFWKLLVGALAANIEEGVHPKICELSLRCLRLLAACDPYTVTPLLQYTLLPFVVNLGESESCLDHPEIRTESQRLLKMIGCV